MPSSSETTGPYPFTAADLQQARLQAGIRHTLADFYHWQDTNPAMVAEHINLYSEQLQLVKKEGDVPARIGRLTLPSREQVFRTRQTTRELGYFTVYNLSELADPEFIQSAAAMVARPAQAAIDELGRIQKGPFQANDASRLLETMMPDLQNVPELTWLEAQLRRLHRILPEHVIRDGGMGKVLRTMVGTLAIGAFDVRDEPDSVRRSHLAHILPAAYAYGATYPIIDDTLHDSDYIPQKDKARYHHIISDSLANGALGDTRILPDHPLSEELERLFTTISDRYPITSYPHLYDAASSMYHAQHRDAHLTAADIETLDGVRDMYPDMFIKASMSRVVANILGRRRLDTDYCRRGINTTFITQLRDDLADSDTDRTAGRLTPFTYPARKANANPLYDLLAYEKYIVQTIHNGDADTANYLAFVGSTLLATRLSGDRRHHRAQQLVDNYETTPELKRYLHTAGHISRRALATVKGIDKVIQQSANHVLKVRQQTDIDPRTFISDRLSYINDILRVFNTKDSPNALRDITSYALEAGGKRLRPALTLMLAEGLGEPYQNIEPLLTAAEMFHTASLLFDDLPAQDNATTRRNRPTAHTVYPESDVQLTGISMISSGFGAIAALREQYPANRVAEVVEYLGGALGPERLCLGQHLDLHMQQGSTQATGEAILKMYELKTSTALEAALVPLMMLKGRSGHEISLMKRYAKHAGIVFQLRDDILDIIGDANATGKDTGNDQQKINIVRFYGLEAAELLMQEHIQQSIDAARALPFNTSLLQGLVQYFAVRTR